MKTGSETDVMQHCITKRKSLLIKAFIVKAKMVNTKFKKPPAKGGFLIRMNSCDYPSIHAPHFYKFSTTKNHSAN